ncbi:MAG TPA: hypothetical protein VHC69_15540 [Polyangiaceae bacterium]|nr:hypothetical protein [Polyangiaceae bacterium]
MGRLAYASWVTLSFIVACSSEVNPRGRPTPQPQVVSSPRGDAGNDETPPSTTTANDGGDFPACDSDPTARVICTESASGVPWGAEVVVAQGAGQAPSPGSGTIAPGQYQLISQTVYGSVQPNTSSVHVGDRVKRVLLVDCDVAYELYEQSSAGSSGSASGNDCRRLDPHPLSLLSLSGLMEPGITDLRDHVAYTARGDHLILSEVYAYSDGTPFDILGAYTYVSDFVRVGSAAATTPSSATDGGTTATAGRDPRCPATPPSNGDACSPEPSPIECEYGGDSFGNCTTLAECELSLTDRTFRFQLAPKSDCTPPNPKECPATFAAASAMAAQNPNGSGPTCYYAEGVCGCVVPRGGPILSGAQSCNWTCRDGKNDALLAPGCPWPRPLAGDPCTTGMECDYGGDCGGEPSLGPNMICQQGHWLDVNFVCN